MNQFQFKNILGIVRNFKMKRILILNCIVLFISINFCKDNTQSENSRKIQALSSLAIQTQNAKNQSQESTTCDSQVYISDYIYAAVAKYQDCKTDSECTTYNGGSPTWGERCYSGCTYACGGPSINSNMQTALAKDLIKINETYCQGTRRGDNCATAHCSASCVHPNYIKNKCINQKCSIEVLPYP